MNVSLVTAAFQLADSLSDTFRMFSFAFPELVLTGFSNQSNKGNINSHTHTHTNRKGVAAAIPRVCVVFFLSSFFLVSVFSEFIAV